MESKEFAYEWLFKRTIKDLDELLDLANPEQYHFLRGARDKILTAHPGMEYTGAVMNTFNLNQGYRCQSKDYITQCDLPVNHEGNHKAHVGRFDERWWPNRIPEKKRTEPRAVGEGFLPPLPIPVSRSIPSLPFPLSQPTVTFPTLNELLDQVKKMKPEVLPTGDAEASGGTVEPFECSF